MGQRLVVTIQKNNQDIAKIYYHWSAYSISALEETREIINVLYDDDNEEKDLRLRLIRFCENSGGGIDGGENSDEWNYITSLYPNKKFKTENINRNYGLIALSEKGMDDIQGWSEGNIYIDLDENRVENSVYCYYDDINYYNEEHSEWDEDFTGESLESIPEITGDLGSFHIDDIDIMIDQLKSLDGYVCRCNGEIYELIA